MSTLEGDGVAIGASRALEESRAIRESRLRIELERPRGYWEDNVVAARRDVRTKLIERLRPLAGRTIADVGCGAGGLAGRLARDGARVIGVDRCPRPGDWRRSGAAHYVVADAREAPMLAPPDAIVAQEVLEHIAPTERCDFLQGLESWGAPRVLLVLRIPNRLGRWLDEARAFPGAPVLDPTDATRQVHLATSLRLFWQTEVRRRNYSARIVEFRPVHDGREV